jgi:hypothetical protein
MMSLSLRQLESCAVVWLQPASNVFVDVLPELSAVSFKLSFAPFPHTLVLSSII